MSSSDTDVTTSLLIYAVPAIIALATKLVIYWLGRKTLANANPFLWMLLVSLSALNIAELASFQYVDKPAEALLILQMYYAAALAAVVSYAGLAVSIYTNRPVQIVGYILFMLWVIVSSTLAIPQVLTGAESIGYSVTRIAGPYFFVVHMTLAAMLLTGLGFLLVAASNTRRLSRQRANAALIATAPMVLVGILIMLLMALGYKVNASVVLPLTINFMLAVLVYCEYKQRLFKFLSHVPLTREYKEARSFGHILAGDMGLNLSESLDLVERTILIHALEKTQFKLVKTAEYLQLNRSTLNRRLKKHQLERTSNV